MIRPSIFAGAVLAVLLSVACDKATDDQQKANNAQTEANDKIAAAQKESTTKINSAQAEADKKIASAEADFAKLREDYRHKTTTDLVDIDKKIADLEAKAKTATGKAKIDLDANLAQIHSRRAAYATDYKTMDNASATTWDSTKVRLDQEYSDLKSLVDKS